MEKCSQTWLPFATESFPAYFVCLSVSTPITTAFARLTTPSPMEKLRAWVRPFRRNVIRVTVDILLRVRSLAEERRRYQPAPLARREEIHSVLQAQLPQLLLRSRGVSVQERGVSHWHRPPLGWSASS